MTVDRALAAFLLSHIPTGSWISASELKDLAAVHWRQDIVPVLVSLEEDGLIWHSYEAVLPRRRLTPVLISRYCRSFEIGDPPIGHRIVREVAA